MKNTALIALSCFLSVTALAQAPEETAGDPKEESREAKKQLIFGVRAGLSKSNVYSTTSGLSTSSRNGLSGGVFMALPVGSLLGIQPELILIQKGFNGSGTLQGESYNITRTTTHLDIPIMLQVKPFRWFTFLIGPQYSYLIKQTDEVSLGSNQQVDSEFKKVDLNENLFGTLVGFDFNIRHVVLSWRSGWDLTANHSGSASGVPTYKNRWTQITLGYRFY